MQFYINRGLIFNQRFYVTIENRLNTHEIKFYNHE